MQKNTNFIENYAIYGGLNNESIYSDENILKLPCRHMKYQQNFRDFNIFRFCFIHKKVKKYLKSLQDSTGGI